MNLRLIKETDTELTYEVDGQIITCSQHACSHGYTWWYFVYNNTAYIVKYPILDRGCHDIIAYLSSSIQYSQVVYL
jgi:hypothetical protein